MSLQYKGKTIATIALSDKTGTNSYLSKLQNNGEQ